METVRNLLRLFYLVLACLMVVSGLFWALQGLGIIMWPPESFMLADRAWTLYGLIWATLWAGLIWVLRSRRSGGE
jgi:uncharacterized membrane protein